MLERNELHRIRRFTEKAEQDKAFHTLEGILKGILLDDSVNVTEMNELVNWCNSYMELINDHPFNEVIPMVNRMLKDDIIDSDEVADLKWLLSQITNSNRYYDVITSGIQRLEGILHGVLADNEISNREIDYIEEWLFDHEELCGTYPFDEIQSLIVGIKEDGIITEEERKYLMAFISDFINRDASLNIDFSLIDEIKKEMTVSGICTLNPHISFEGKKFCFTGVSKEGSRKTIASKIESFGGTFMNNITNDTDFLIVGCNGNPCWAFSAYGRKIEKAMELRKNGSRIEIVNETDFWDAILDFE